MNYETELKRNRIGLYLMSCRGLATLAAILREFGADVVGYVVTASDGSVRNDYRDDITKQARDAGLQVFERRDLPPELPAVNARFAVGWRWLLPESKSEPIVVFHDSLLPRYRGFAPLANSLINGENLIGVTALLAGEEYDAGPILAQESVSITYPIRIAEAIDAINPRYAKLVAHVIRGLSIGALAGNSQDTSRASYSLWRDEDDYFIDWSQSAVAIRRHVDATGFPYRGAAVTAEGRTYRVLAATELEDVEIENRAPGKIIFMASGRPVVVCGSGLLRIEEMVEDASTISALPWRRFRTRFAGERSPPNQAD